MAGGSAGGRGDGAARVLRAMGVACFSGSGGWDGGECWCWGFAAWSQFVRLMEEEIEEGRVWVRRVGGSGLGMDGYRGGNVGGEWGAS